MPAIEPLDWEDSNQEQAWREWSEHIEDAFTAFNIMDDKRQLSLLRFYGGKKLKDIIKTLTPEIPPGQVEPTYKTTKLALDEYFIQKTNKVFERHKFRMLNQENEESTHDYVTRLRTQGAKCNFGEYNLDKAIVDQLIEKCSSSKLRRAYLKESDLSVEEALQRAFIFESTETQARQIEEDKGEHSEIHKITSNYKQQQRYNGGYSKQSRDNSPLKPVTKCYGCNGSDHIHGQTKCPAFGKKCNYCGVINHFEKTCFKKRNSGKGITNMPDGHNYVQPVSTNQNNSDSQAFVFRVKPINSTDSEIVHIDDVPIEILIDSGADINLIDGNTFKEIIKSRPNLTLKETNCKPKAYGNIPIPLIGEFFATLTNGPRRKAHKVFVTKARQGGNILSKRASIELGFITTPQVKSITRRIPKTTKEILDRHLPSLEGLGRMKDFQLKIRIDNNVVPVAQPPRRTPFHIQQAVEEKIKEMLDNNIIERVEGPTPWVSPLVAVPKPNGDIRICADLRVANKAVKRTRYQIPTVEQLLSEMGNAGIFSKIDLNSYYHQIELDPESRDITTFSCNSGIYRYKVLVMGITSAAEEGQRLLQQILQKIPNCRNGADDILIWGKDTTEHNRTLDMVLRTLKENNLTISQHKSIFHREELEFHGFIVSNTGIRPTDSKIEAIKNFKNPGNVQDIRSFLGLINYLTKFIPRLATLSEPLKRLTRANMKWRWTKEEESCFIMLKETVIQSKPLMHFDPQLQTSIVVDASPVGLGAILCQNKQGILVPISYASRTLTEVERRYCQLEKEALAIVWACEKFHFYLYGKNFLIMTDHQALTTIFNPKGNPSARILRWILRLQQYDYTIKHINGKDNPADILSRQPMKYQKVVSPEEEIAEGFINTVVANSIPKTITLSEIMEESQRDPTVTAVKNAIQQNDWTNKLTEPFKHVRNELTTKRGVVIRGARIIIPQNLQKQILKLAHETHMGIMKTKALLRTKVWWPKIDKDIEAVISRCIPCTALDPKKNHRPVHMAEMKGPWEILHVDICGPFPCGDYVIGIIDAGSRWPEAFVTKSTRVDIIISTIQNCFYTHGIPVIIVSDNGPQFRSSEFNHFCKDWGIKHRRVTPYHPQANGEIERFFSTMLKAIRAMNTEGKDWRKHLGKFLMYYRNSPHAMTGETPAKLLMGREVNINIPGLQKRPENQTWRTARQKDQKEKDRLKNRTDQKNKAKPTNIGPGDIILLRQSKHNKLTPVYDPTPWRVKERRGDSAIIARRDKLILRHTSQMKRIPEDRTRQQLTDDDFPFNGNLGGQKEIEHERESEEEREEADMPIALRRTRRNIRKPRRYASSSSEEEESNLNTGERADVMSAI